MSAREFFWLAVVAALALLLLSAATIATLVEARGAPFFAHGRIAPSGLASAGAPATAGGVRSDAGN